MGKRVVVLGSTGSIGRNTLSVLEHLGGDWRIVGLAAGSRGRELAIQAGRVRPEAVALAEGCAEDLAGLPAGCRVLTGPGALVRLVDEVACDCVVSAVVGTGGLAATLRAVELGRRVALANKESLVIAGSLLMPLAQRTGAEIIPVDSEHSAVFQSLQAGRRGDVRMIYLTASGGPFRTWSREAMSDVSPEEALRHPTWEMGPKITIDSATMMNKALEIVEAHWLFGVRSDQIGVVIHPESIVHSLVEYHDGSMIAQVGTPDMRTPIQYALTYPQRVACPSRRLDLHRLGRLHFDEPDPGRFPALRLGHEVAARGGTSGAVLNAANEAAVSLFREGAIRFDDIARLTEGALSKHGFIAAPGLDELLAADRWAREEVTRCAVCS